MFKYLSYSFYLYSLAAELSKEKLADALQISFPIYLNMTGLTEGQKMRHVFASFLCENVTKSSSVDL